MLLDRLKVLKDLKWMIQYYNFLIDKDSIGEYQSLIPLQRVGNNDDIATWALFLASPAASYFTG